MELESRWPKRFTVIAAVHAAIGDPESAFSWLQRGIAANPDRPPIINGMPRRAAWMPYSQDPRWQSYLEVIHRSPARLSAIEFNPDYPSAIYPVN